MRLYVCKAKDGPLFVASDELAEVLDFAAAARLAVNNGAWRVTLGAMPCGDAYRYAVCDRWRVVACSGGDYARQERRPQGWECSRSMPPEVEAALCFALGLAVRRAWTPDEILAKES